MDKETRDLSIRVYEKLGWDGYGLSHEHISTSDGYDEFDLPLYTSDYLLEKLPYYIDTHDARGTFEFFLKKTSLEYHAGYNKPELGRWLDDNNHGVWEQVMHADTPLKALLKLTLALSDTNTLKENE